MTVAPVPSKSLRLAKTDHPRFVGLALLRSLLSHQELASDAARSDVVLDLISLLLRDAPPKPVIKAFCRVRRTCGPVCYLAVFRLRRWLEQRIVVKTGAGPWQPLVLAFADLRRIEQNYRRGAWETTSPANTEWNEVSVDFAWACEDFVPLREEGVTA